VSSGDDNLKLEENEPRDYLVSPTNKMKIKKREREVNTETVGAAGHGLYRCLWAVRACSAQWRALIRSWATPHMTGATFILRGVKLLQCSHIIAI
jgi:hypothetical protein